MEVIEEEAVYPTPKSSVKNLRRNVTINELPLLQQINPYDGAEEFHPVNEDGASYDLIAPYEGHDAPLHKLERLSDVMFGMEHMLSILNNPRYLARFRVFLLEERPRSMSTLTYYLNAAKALKSIEFANALVRLSIDVPPPAVQAVQTDNKAVGTTGNKILEQRVQDGLRALTAEELPAFITSRCITITSKIVEERVRGSLPMKFRNTSNALAEVFCLTDPSRPDNPIIFASEGKFIHQSILPLLGKYSLIQSFIAQPSTAWITCSGGIVDFSRAQRRTRTAYDDFGKPLKNADIIPSSSSISMSAQFSKT